MNYQEFKVKAEEKGYVQLSEYIIPKNYIISRFEIWSGKGDDFMCVEVFSNDDVIFYKQTDTL